MGDHRLSSVGWILIMQTTALMASVGLDDLSNDIAGLERLEEKQDTNKKNILVATDLSPAQANERAALANERAQPPGGGKSSGGSKLKVYTYPLPEKYLRIMESGGHNSQWMRAFNEQFKSINKLMQSVATNDPKEANAFWVPLDLAFMHWHVPARSLQDFLTKENLQYLSTGRPHIVFDATDKVFAKPAIDYWNDSRFITLVFESKLALLPKNIGITPVPLTEDKHKGVSFTFAPGFVGRQYSPPHFNLDLQTLDAEKEGAHRSYLYGFIGSNGNSQFGPIPVRKTILETSQCETKSDCAVMLHGVAKEKLGEKAYTQILASSEFCPSPRGIGQWSWRFYEAITYGCVPVLMADHYKLPFSNKVRWSDFTAALPERVAGELDFEIRKIAKQKGPALRAELKKFAHEYTEANVHRWILEEINDRVFRVWPGMQNFI